MQDRFGQQIRVLRLLYPFLVSVHGVKPLFPTTLDLLQLSNFPDVLSSISLLLVLGLLHILDEVINVFFQPDQVADRARGVTIHGLITKTGCIEIVTCVEV